MSLETGNRIQDLVPTNPVGATDFVSQGDDHLRLVKAAVKGSFPSLGANAVSASAEELNILDGATLTTAELNYVDGVTSAIQTQLNAKLASTDYTAADVLAKLLTVDGPGSSLDADTLDGQSSAYYRNADNLNAGTLADARLSSNVPLKDNGNIFTASQTITAASPVMEVNGTSLAPRFQIDNNGTRKAYFILALATNDFVNGLSANDAALCTAGGKLGFSVNDGGSLAAYMDGTTLRCNGTLTFSGGIDVRSVALINSTSTTLLKGQIHHITGNATLPALDAGEWICIVNNSGSSITITEHSGDTTYWTATAASVSTLTVPARGRIVASGAGSSVVYVSGDISGST